MPAGSNVGLLRGTEFMNWYQIISPIGFSVNEKSRVEILKVADESDIRLRNTVPWAFPKERIQDVMLEESELQEFAPSQQSEEHEESSGTAKEAEQEEMTTYLPSDIKDVCDEEQEIQDIFWELLKSSHPTCPDGLDLQAIRDALAERRAKLGRVEKEPSEEDLFDKYGLGMNAHRKPEESPDASGNLKPQQENLLDMINRMAAERTKPEPHRNDMYDKNNPVRGKVAFRRTEFGDGPKEYTDLDEELSFGDTEKDVDFGKYLVQKKRGRFDSKGNFIPGIYDANGNFIPGKFDSKGNFIPGKFDSKGNFIPGIFDEKGNFIPGKYDSRGNFIPVTFDSNKNVILEADKTDGKESEGKKRKKGKRNRVGTDSDSPPISSTKGKSLTDMTESERRKYLEGLRNAKRHPEVDFPLCNYPKWVHRMYRMDQVQIGQLIKQGMDVPEYTPPWMLETLDRVWGVKDKLTRGVIPSKDPKQGLSRFRESQKTGGTDKKSKKGGEGETDKKAAGRKSRYDRDGSSPLDGEAGIGAQATGREGGAGKGGAAGESGAKGLGGAAGEGGAKGLGGAAGEGGAKGLGGAAGEGGAKGSGGAGDGLEGLAGFLQGYEKEAVDLARLDAANAAKGKGRNDEFDINDLIDNYREELEKEHNVDKRIRQKIRGKELRNEKARRINEIQEAALKRIRDKELKLKQQRKKTEAEEQEMLTKKQKGKNERKNEKKLQGSRGSSDMLVIHKGHGKGKKGRRRDSTGKKGVHDATDPCAEFKVSKQTRDDECMMRFRVLLGGQRSRFFGGTDFVELAKQISLIKYPPRPPKKTPCEKAEMPICR